ncbi:MAG: hypothetical protein Q4G03_07095 [Planctomycetia bacterium]|nr:hypothetical protein [Planctomycetia bacterium]
MKLTTSFNPTQQPQRRQSVLTFCLLLVAVFLSACGCSSHQCPFKRNTCNDCDKNKLEELESRAQSNDLTPDAPKPPTNLDRETVSLLDGRQNVSEPTPQNGGANFVANASNKDESVYDFHNHPQPDVVPTQPVTTQSSAQPTFSSSAPSVSSFVSVAPTPGQTFAPGSISTTQSDYTSMLPAELQATMTPATTEPAAPQTTTPNVTDLQLPPELRILPASSQAVPTYDSQRSWLAPETSAGSTDLTSATSLYHSAVASDVALRSLQESHTVARTNLTSATDSVVVNRNAPNNGYVVNYPSVPTAPTTTTTKTTTSAAPNVAPTVTTVRASNNSSAILPGLVSGQVYDARATATPMH